MEPKNWSEIRDGFVRQSKNVLDFVEYCHVNNINPAKEFKCECTNNEIQFAWTHKVYWLQVWFLPTGEVVCISQLPLILDRKNQINLVKNNKVADFFYEDLNKYFKENI